jgi:plastocyanin
MKNLLMVLLFLLNSSLIAAEVEVIIQKFKFIPAEITINKGDTIIWINKEKRQYHSVWFEKLGEPEPDYFFPDEIYKRDFGQSGDFPYRCGPHPEMIGIVHVKN